MNTFSLLPMTALQIAKPDPMGGQALIEGVMMRSKDKVSVALRRKDGTIQERVDAHVSFRERHPVFKWPVVRGAITLAESLVLGMRYLTWSADMAALDEKGGVAAAKKSAWESVMGFGSIAVALCAGVALFMYSPLWLAGLLGKNKDPLTFNLMAGFIRIFFFLAYVWLIARMKDVQRVFQYHGAEHKSIHAYEEGPVTVQSARPHPTAHPRCGTSFLLIAGLACILVFAAIDALYIHFAGPYHSAFHRLLVHLSLVPLVSGISYEALRFSDKHRSRSFVGYFMLPGLWLQKITTAEPDDSQLEVAIVSLKNAL
jgi:uncharacterized protein YqhQ